MWTTLLTFAAALALAHGHGRVLDPPGRGSLWRVGYSAKANYDDDGLNCGGYYHQYSVNGGKCGICGDPYDAASPRPHERGGIYDSGIIAASYEAGSILTATVQITAHHMGYWEFKLCPDPNYTEQDCFDANPLELEEGGTKYYPGQGSNTYVVNYRLPQDLSCDNCVLQWRYTCGNNWGDCNNGTQGLGCGDQENFGACSDISITGGSGVASSQIPVDSLLLAKLSDLGLIRLVLGSYVKPYHWVPRSTVAPPQMFRNTVAPPQRINSKRRKHKGKKKVKPYKSKWVRWTIDLERCFWCQFIRLPKGIWYGFDLSKARKRSCATIQSQNKSPYWR